MKHFSKLNKTFVGCFDPKNIFLDNKVKKVWGDLTDISAKKTSPVGEASRIVRVITVRTF